MGLFHLLTYFQMKYYCRQSTLWGFHLLLKVKPNLQQPNPTALWAYLQKEECFMGYMVKRLCLLSIPSAEAWRTSFVPVGSFWPESSPRESTEALLWKAAAVSSGMAHRNPAIHITRVHTSTTTTPPKKVKYIPSFSLPSKGGLNLWALNLWSLNFVIVRWEWRKWTEMLGKVLRKAASFTWFSSL